MHVTETALFLTVVVLIVATPFVLLGAGIVRRRAATSTSTQAYPRPSAIGALSIALVAVTAIGGVAVWFARSSPSDATDMAGMDMGASSGIGVDAVPLPGMLGGLPMVDSVSGPAALEQVAQLHGSTFDIVDATVATYLGGPRTSTVWVAWAADPLAAEEMTRAMADRIGDGGSPFEPPTRWARDRSVWLTEGMGQRHYFFARGNAVWWLAADGDAASSALADLLRVAEP